MGPDRSNDFFYLVFNLEIQIVKKKKEKKKKKKKDSYMLDPGLILKFCIFSLQRNRTTNYKNMGIMSHFSHPVALPFVHYSLEINWKDASLYLIRTHYTTELLKWELREFLRS